MKKFFPIIFLSFLILVTGCSKAPTKVLLVFSYHQESPWVINQTSGVEDVFTDKGFFIEKFYMDTKRHTSQEWETRVSKEAMKKIESMKPDVVMLFDDNACELVGKEYIGKDIPFVFCGMNGNPEDYGFPAENITGVVERFHIQESINLLKKIVPDAKKMVLISDDGTTSKKFFSRINESENKNGFFELFKTNDFDQWKEKIEEYQESADALGLFLYQTLKAEGQEESIPAKEVIDWTLNNSTLPDFAFFDSVVEDGVLCGVTLSGYEQAKAASEIVLKILNGERITDIPVSKPEKVEYKINDKRAAQLNITIPDDLLDKFGE